MNSSFTILLLAASFLLVSCNHTSLVEISEKIVNASCIRASYQLALVRGYLSTGMVDPNLKSNINVLLAAEVEPMVYMNPCVKCGNGKGQVDAVFKAIGVARMPIGVYVMGDQWGNDQEANKMFLLEIVMSIMLLHASPSFVITNKYQWEKILGKSVVSLLLTQLIYISVDHNENCGNYDPFNYWEQPFGKKYESDKQVCGQEMGVIRMCMEDANGMWGRLTGVHA